MVSLLTLEDIDQAVINLNYRNKDVLPYRLVSAIRQFYRDERSVESLKEIDSEALVKALWNTVDDPEATAKKRKQLSNVKSCANGNLKRLYKEGKNPGGIVIGRSNIFVMCDEAKDKALETLKRSNQSDETATLGQIADMLRRANELISKQGAFIDTEGSGGTTTWEQIKELIQSLSERSGLEAISATDSFAEGTAIGEVQETAAEPDVEELNGSYEDLAGVFDGGHMEGEAEIAEEVIPEEEVTLDEILEIEDSENPDEGEAMDDLQDVETDDNLEEDEHEAAIQEASADNDLEGSEAGESQGDKEAAGDTYKAEEKEGSGPSRGMLEDSTGAGERTDRIEGPGKGEGVISEGTRGVQLNAEPGTEEVIEEPEDTQIDEAIEEVEEVDYLEDTGPADEDIEEDEAAEAPEEVEADIDEAEPEEGFLHDDLKGSGDREGEGEIDISMGDAAGEYPNGGYEEGDTIRKARLLAEEFNSLLGARDKYYNQYILIPEGAYVVGSKQPKGNQKHERAVHLAPFYIGRFPVTNSIFEIFVEKTGYRTTAEKRGYGTVYRGRFRRWTDEKTGLPGVSWNAAMIRKTIEGACWHQPSGPGSTIYNKKHHPVVQISLEDALAFAAWTGKRLPTEDEWEAASRTAQGLVFPWGNDWREDACNIEESSIGDTTAVDRYISFANKLGIADTVGNAWELTSDRCEPSSGAIHKSHYYICKGGSWMSENEVRLFGRLLSEPESSSNILGFRCVAY
jgi:formylglycine-generating enzyme required for sulfatase activity